MESKEIKITSVQMSEEPCCESCSCQNPVNQLLETLESFEE